MRTKPPALPDGGRIAVVAPSSPPQIRSEIEQATDYFTKLGYEVVFGPHHRDGTRSATRASSAASPTSRAST
jgi:muramoyltetrapeptide carboxypeptidase LdcA involved in peptidoglycan recycling